MDSRRSALKKILAGAASAAAVPTAAAATRNGSVSLAGEAAASFVLPNGPSPWWLIAPIATGTALGYGWYVHGLGGVERGASVLSLRHVSGRSARVHICAHQGRPQGISSTELIDLVLMDGGSGSAKTDEGLGRVVLGIGERIRRNELDPDGDLRPLAKMMTHSDRVVEFGAKSL